MKSPEYVNGEQFLKAVDELGRLLPKEVVPHMLKIIHAEVGTLFDGLRMELHKRLETVFKDTELERMQVMRDLEGRITKAIAENARRDKIRFRWVMVSVVITIANLTALSILLAKVKGLL